MSQWIDTHRITASLSIKLKRDFSQAEQFPVTNSSRLWRFHIILVCFHADSRASSFETINYTPYHCTDESFVFVCFIGHRLDRLNKLRTVTLLQFNEIKKTPIIKFWFQNSNSLNWFIHLIMQANGCQWEQSFPCVCSASCDIHTQNNEKSRNFAGINLKCWKWFFVVCTSYVYISNEIKLYL